MNSVEKSKEEACIYERITEDIISHIDKYPEDYEFQSGTNNKIYFKDKKTNAVFSLTLNKEYDVYEDLVTDETFIKLFESVDTTHFSDEQIALFDVEEIKKHDDESYIPFHDKNWNSGQDLLRYFLNRLYMVPSVDEHFANLHMKCICKENEGDHMWLIIDEFNDNTIYMITWYKNRGRTDSITIDGFPIDFYDYKDLINKLATEPAFREIFKKILDERLPKEDIMNEET